MAIQAIQWLLVGRVWMIECVLSSKNVAKRFIHSRQAYERVRWWTTFLCIFKLHNRVNDFSHSSQANGRSPECEYEYFSSSTTLWWMVFLCVAKVTEDSNVFSQRSQMCKSPCWTNFLCLIKLSDWVNILSYWSHAKERIALWTAFLWAANLDGRMNDLLQWLHVCDFPISLVFDWRSTSFPISSLSNGWSSRFSSSLILPMGSHTENLYSPCNANE